MCGYNVLLLKYIDFTNLFFPVEQKSLEFDKESAETMCHGVMEQAHYTGFISSILLQAH